MNELEEAISKLLFLAEKRKLLGKEKYHVDKEYSSLEKEASDLLRNGVTLPAKSPYYAELVEEPYGRVNYAYVVERLGEEKPRLKPLINTLIKESRERLVERLRCGLK